MKISNCDDDTCHALLFIIPVLTRFSYIRLSSILLGRYHSPAFVVPVKYSLQAYAAQLEALTFPPGCDALIILIVLSLPAPTPSAP